MTWAGARSPDRIAAVGVLAVRPLPYRSDQAPLGLEAIPGLVVRALGQDETPIWHPSTGIYGFLRLPPGPIRLEIEDPARRWVPLAARAQVPDRSAIRDLLGRGVTPAPGSTGPLVLELGMRPGPEQALPPGSTALWGQIRESADSRPVAGALLGLDTVLHGAADRVQTLSGPDGTYLLALPGELPDRSHNPPVRRFPRDLWVASPLPALAAALRGPGGFVAGLPADLYGLTQAERAPLFRSRGFRLRLADGRVLSPAGGQNPQATVSIGERVRWDIELLP